jgi:hypothetical protein
MDRRHFIHTGLAGAVTLRLAQGSAGAQEAKDPAPHARRIPKLVTRAVTTPNAGLPAVTPLFSGIFLPGKAAASLMRSDSWDDFVAQTQTQANIGNGLACFTTMQTFNRTFYYGAFQQGAGGGQLLRFSDENSFHAAFQRNQGAVLKWLTQGISVTVGGQLATVGFDGSAPTFVDGVDQLKIQLSANTPSGTQPIVINMGGISSPTSVTLNVQ